jgi:hypothetical protein
VSVDVPVVTVRVLGKSGKPLLWVWTWSAEHSQSGGLPERSLAMHCGTPVTARPALKTAAVLASLPQRGHRERMAAKGLDTRLIVEIPYKTSTL